MRSKHRRRSRVEKFIVRDGITYAWQSAFVATKSPKAKLE
jgi:hypothetical protein